MATDVSHDSEDWIDQLEDTFERASAHNRPRSKRRPRHESAVPARVLGVDRGRYSVVPLADSGITLRANRARELARESIVVGDLVDVVGDTSGGEGTLARIVRIHPRSNVLRRSADDSDLVERVIVANVDQLLMVVAARDPEPRPRLIDRYIVAAVDAGIAPLLCVTKTDLAPATELEEYLAGLDVDVFAVRGDGKPDDIDSLRIALRDKTTVAVGHSGVGKSTLVNRLAPLAQRDVGSVNLTTGRGRHTSSSSRAIALPGGGWVIDTPGVRSFGLGHVSTDALDRGFPDLARFLENCPRGCRHLPVDSDCGLRGGLSLPEVDAGVSARIGSLLRLHQAAGSTDD